MFLYTFGVIIIEAATRLASLWNRKAKLWIEGRRDLTSKVREAVGKDDKVFWIHAASVGEFEQGRPIIEYVREHHPEYRIALTFYSPSGYELRKNYNGADWVFYLPVDRPAAVRGFLDALHPQVAVIVKYEFWLNLLGELRRRKVRTFIVSALFRRDSLFFKWYGGLWRQALRTFETIFVQDDDSAKRLASIGVTDVVVAGDTRFDRVWKITRTAGSVPLVESFIGGSDARVFVAGSTWGPDEDILIPLVQSHPGVKFILAPHEMDEQRIVRICRECNAVRYTNPGDAPQDAQVLIIDTIGLLSTIYRYADWAYIGGGFGVGIHNTVEPATYGLPIAFGPKYTKFNEALDMVRYGIACPVTNYDELKEWFEPLFIDENLRRSVCDKAASYTASQIGATDTICSKLNL